MMTQKQLHWACTASLRGAHKFEKCHFAAEFLPFSKAAARAAELFLHFLESMLETFNSHFTKFDKSVTI